MKIGERIKEGRKKEGNKERKRKITQDHNEHS
jgi:hypothetical protein